MGKGHSFECAKYLFLPSLSFALDENEQFIHRVWRLNSREDVTIFPFVMTNTIDELMAADFSDKLDSAQLGKPLSRGKRFRYRFKPFITPDEEMLDSFDACIGLSRGVGKFATARRQEFLWMPGGCTPERFKAAATAGEKGPIRSGRCRRSNWRVWRR